MKILPCSTCKDGQAKAGDLPYYADRYFGVGGIPFVYKCSACGTRMSLSAPEFNRIPHLAELPGALREHLGPKEPPS